MAFTYDPTTPRGLVRLLIHDTDDVTAANQIFQDNEIDAFLNLEGDNVKRAAAQALMSIAAKEALILKVMKLLDITTDGAKLANSLREQAKQWREEADVDEAAAGDDFDWAEPVYDVFSARQKLINEALRDG
ncbi:MAG: hypothetical protein DWQ07_12750 [Chloroflexi bacterium]|nr:MAG: hypothetical protein DWQ07_12750 [Chloroflexota bacterium]MBL1196908.1 hypothetical protein [Chloroflexota bacterium]NOH14204.1 hypothetical protein [Chloroflexota bacterium]